MNELDGSVAKELDGSVSKKSDESVKNKLDRSVSNKSRQKRLEQNKIEASQRNLNRSIFKTEAPPRNQDRSVSLKVLIPINWLINPRIFM